MTDNRGTPLKVGDRVAYNISGEVAVGKILRLVQGKYEASGYGWMRCVKKPLIEVQLEHRAAGQPAGHISKVRHETNVIVLKEDEH